MAAHEMNAGQTITACGRLRSITTKIKRIGTPRFNIRAKIYDYVPVGGELGLTLPNYLGQSTNTIAASTLTPAYTDETFLFNDIEVTGQFTVVFEYETVVNHTQFDLAIFAVGSLFPFGSVYDGGIFVYYIDDSGFWWIYPDADLVFSCDYCVEECPTTTTTTYQREPLR